MTSSDGTVYESGPALGYLRNIEQLLRLLLVEGCVVTFEQLTAAELDELVPPVDESPF